MLTWALAACADASAGAQSPPLSSRLREPDLAYRGAFHLPVEFDHGARAASYRPGGNGGAGSLLITGNDGKTAEWTEVDLPPLDPMGTLDRAPTARLLGPMRSYAGDLIERATTAGQTRPGGLECVAPRGRQTAEVCYWSANWWYTPAIDGDYRPIGMSAADGSRPRGSWHVGPRGDGVFHATRLGHYLFEVPRWYADRALGGRSMMAGGASSNGSNGGSQGPTLFAFAPWQQDDPDDAAELDAVALVYYRHRFPECAGPGVGDPKRCDFPGYRADDSWEGGAFISAGERHAVVLSGVKGLGTNRYGTAEPGDCSIYKGYHSDPYQSQLLFYDVDQLAGAARGAVRPWRVVPYLAWHPPQFRERCPEMGGVAHDSTGGRLFVIEKGYRGDDNAAVVHVFGVARDRR